MVLLGTIVNALAIILGGVVGLAVGKALNKKLSDAVMTAIGLVVVYIGISGSLSGQNTLVTIFSMAIGCIIGTLLDLDDKMHRLGKKVESLVSKNGDGSFAKGFVNASLLFCVGAMAVVGSLNSGLRGDHSMLYTKALLDGISSIVFASSLGVGVIASAVPILIYQGAIALLAEFIEPFLSTYAINEMTCVGSLLIAVIGLNMMKITDIKVMNFIPAIFLPIGLCLIIPA